MSALSKFRSDRLCSIFLPREPVVEIEENVTDLEAQSCDRWPRAFIYLDSDLLYVILLWSGYLHLNLHTRRLAMQKRLSPVCSFWVVFLLILALFTDGCGPSSAIRMPDQLPSIVREYKHMSISPWKTSLFDTEIHLDRGDFFSILIDAYYKRYSLAIKIEQEYIYTDYFSTAPMSGNLKIGSYHRNRKYSIGVNIIVWQKKDWPQIADFLKAIAESDPGNIQIARALFDANRYKEIYLAEVKTSKEINEIKLEIGQLEEKPPEEKTLIAETPTGQKPDGQMTAISADLEKQEKIALLESKLAQLTQNLAQFEEMKAQLENERKKSSLLIQELAEKEKSEKELITRLRHGFKAPPFILIISPDNESEVEFNTIYLQGVVEDDQGLTGLEFLVNDKPLEKSADRDIRAKEKGYLKRLDFKQQIALEKGTNKISVRATDTDTLSAEKILFVHYTERRSNIWAVVIGIDTYPHIRQLKYAVEDAKLFYEYLVKYNHIPQENVTLLSNHEATLTQMRSTLGTYLKSIAGKNDMVVIFFAGHGATEKDVMSPDGDGLEKYLLPYDANPKDLYATALPMREISHIFKRIQAERLVFIADSCYSGASGGRTIDITGIRASISDSFLDRIAAGKGRVIMTASGANEVSVENDDFGHGVFTFYLVEGLRGKADADRDGLITVDEIYQYVSDKVPQATDQEQHPVKKGTVEGRLILGIIQ